MTLDIYYKTELGAVIDRNKDTRCLTIYIAIRVFHIAIRFLACLCTPNEKQMFYLHQNNFLFLNYRNNIEKWILKMTSFALLSEGKP